MFNLNDLWKDSHKIKMWNNGFSSMINIYRKGKENKIIKKLK
jgi:hypothetical protein